MKIPTRLPLSLASALLLLALLVVPTAMAHEASMNLGIDAVNLTSAKRTSIGDVIVKGTVTCSKTTSGVWVDAYIRQVAGRTNTIRGWGDSSIRCVAGQKVPFAVTVEPESGKFVGGKAVVAASAGKYVYIETDTSYHEHYDYASVRQEMKLSR